MKPCEKIFVSLYKAFDGISDLPTPDCKSNPALVLGRLHRSNRLYLAQGFLPEIVAGKTGARAFPCGHRNLYTLALATVLHEVAHAYELSAQADPAKDEDFRTIAEHEGLSSPDLYEQKNAHEAFAVNLEYFLLDPTFSCRRPLIADYFKNILGFSLPSGFENQCTPSHRVFLHSQSMGLNLKRTADLDPARIYRIDYLFASKGADLMSRWGHAMFRLIVCAPTRKTIGPECLKDVSHHIVASFRAATEGSISYFRGMTGSYGSQLYLYPFNEILEEYTKLDSRDLLSAPIALSTSEQERLITRLTEQYWSYRNKYKFFTNNCADEALRSLQVAVADPDFKK